MSYQATSSKVNRRLLSRLYQDLAELQGNPYPGVAVFTDDADFRKLYLVLTPPSGPWTGLALHFDVTLPDNWPMAPPRVFSSVAGIGHPNLFGSYICCDLLKPTVANQGGYTGGYSPALTLRGLFLQFLTFFSSTKIEEDYGDHEVDLETICLRAILLTLKSTSTGLHLNIALALDLKTKKHSRFYGSQT